MVRAAKAHTSNDQPAATSAVANTLKEELQSRNEELQTEALQTVNAELPSKAEEPSALSNDMKNLRNSPDMAIVFLDRRRHIRRDTSRAARLCTLMPGDSGRPLSDITRELVYPELAPQLKIDSEEVLLPDYFRKTGHDRRWPLVPGSDHAIAHHRPPDRRLGTNVYRYRCFRTTGIGIADIDAHPGHMRLTSA